MRVPCHHAYSRRVNLLPYESGQAEAMESPLSITCRSLQLFHSSPASTRCKLATKGTLPGNGHTGSKLRPQQYRVCSSQNVGLDRLSEEDASKLLDVQPGYTTQTKQQVGFMISAHGWGVHRIKNDDMDLVQQFADVQAEAFHVPTAIFNGFFFTIFKAEVLSSLLYKIRHATPKRFACLVAVPDSYHVSRRKVVGVVDAAAMADMNVLRSLPGVDEYLYISGMAVDSNYRRQKVATVLLQACDLTASEWGFEFLVLQAYEDDSAARCLYAGAGYTIVSMDPLWLSKWLGKRRRVVLAKRTPHCNIE